MIKNHLQKGYSLIELMLAMAILAILASSSAVILTSAIRTTERSLLTAKIRTEGSYITESVSRLVRFSPRVRCTGSGDLQVTSANPIVEDALLSCVTSGSPALGSVASGSADLSPALSAISSDEVDITGCSFVCLPSSSAPVTVQFNFSISDKDHIVTPVDFSSEIGLRNQQ